jgi:phosphomannomutase
MSELTAEIPHYYFAKDKMEIEPDMLDSIMEKVERVFVGHKTDKTDGVKILGENYWIHIRKSGTEPIIRIYVESESTKRSQELVEEVKEKLS